MGDRAEDLLGRIGARVAERRRELDLTQKQLAEKLSTYQANIHQIEHGKQNLTVRTLVNLAEALGMTPEALFAGDTPAKPKARR